MKTKTKKTTMMLAALAAGALMFGAAAAEAAPKKSRVMSGVLNLNTATTAQLDLMPGIGPKAAERIVAYRAKTPFTRPEELVKVKGFGKKKLEKLKAHLTVSGPTTLRVTTSDGEELGAAAQAPQAPQGRAPSAKKQR